MLSSLLLSVFTLAACVTPSFARILFNVQTPTQGAPWPVRIQPAWQTVELGMDVWLQDGSIRKFRPGSMILYGGIGSNDVWITQPGVNVGRDWTLVAGIVRNPYSLLPGGLEYNITAYAPPPWDTTSFRERLVPAVCEDPTSDRSYIISGVEIGTNRYLYGVWRTDDGRTWNGLGRAGEYEPRAWSSCMVAHDNSIILTAGVSEPFSVRREVAQDSFNDVWRSTDFGVSWQQQTDHAQWAGRFETFTFSTRMPVAPRTDMLYVIGGATLGQLSGEPDVYYNDVWASSDYGVSWALITANAPWEGRWGHSGVVTRDGAIVFFGGGVRDDLYERPYNYAYYGDIWASLDGGYTWKECTGRTLPYNRTESAVALDHDGHLLMAAGYSIRQPRPALNPPQLDWHNDVVRSTFSLERGVNGEYDGGRQLADACGFSYPASGVIGLQQWPAERWNSSGGLVAGLVCVVLFVLVVVFGYMYTRNSVKAHGVFRWPTATEIRHKVVTATQMPDVRFITDLPVAEQFRESQEEGQTAPASSSATAASSGNDLGESLLGEGQRSEGSSA